MRNFDYLDLPSSLACNEIMNLLAAVHEYKGKQELFVEARADVLVTLLEIARIQSTGASNRIEGINTSDERLAALVAMKTEPRNRSEEEIAGYREVLTLIHESYDHIPLRPNIILQLHRDLYQFNPSMLGGKYKAADNVIAEVSADGRERVRFKPLPALETPIAVEELCAAFNGALDAGKIDPLLLIPRFILDFLCIHPFADGNGRMSRLLCLLLLYRSGYLVGKYISLETIIEQTKETYYEALEIGSTGWHEGENDCLPFVRHFLEVLLKAYREFSFRVGLTFNRSLSKPDRVRVLFESTLGQLSKKDILDRFPDISTSTVEASLSSLLKEGFIAKIGAGKKTKYIKVSN
ncbi:cell division protein Fic [Spirochaetia bacterium]|nr:cell division protein Fic [Spirochaetia bacterium]